MSLRIVESFNGYSPPFAVIPIVECLVSTVPEKWLVGLDKVVLLNSQFLPRKQRTGKTKRRGRKMLKADIAGTYHQSWKGQPARIEIRVDRIDAWVDSLRWLLKFNFVRECVIGKTLYHEIGHHIHRQHRPEFREPEDVADEWAIRLLWQHFKSKHKIAFRVLGLFVLGYGHVRRRRDSSPARPASSAS